MLYKYIMEIKLINGTEVQMVEAMGRFGGQFKKNGFDFVKADDLYQYVLGVIAIDDVTANMEINRVIDKMIVFRGLKIETIKRLGDVKRKSN